MLVVEFRIDSPILQDSLANAPETTVSYEEVYRITEGIKLLFWAQGGDFTALDDGLATDPTVTDVNQLAETQARRLYRVTLTETGKSVATFLSWSEFDISLLDATATHEGFEVRMRMPDRDALHQYRALCEEKNLQFSLQSIYEEDEATTTAEVQLSSAQQETLTTARELGYYEVPRQASLAEVANHDDISSQAASARLRRGVATLINAAL